MCALMLMLLMLLCECSHIYIYVYTLSDIISLLMCVQHPSSPICVLAYARDASNANTKKQDKKEMHAKMRAKT